MMDFLKAPAEIAGLRAEVAALRDALAASDEGRAADRAAAAQREAGLVERIDRLAARLDAAEGLGARIDGERDAREALRRDLEALDGREREGRDALRHMIDGLARGIVRQGDDLASVTAILFDRIDAARRWTAEAP